MSSNGSSTAKRRAALSYLLHAFHPEGFGELLTGLPEKEQSKIKALSYPNATPPALAPPPESALENVHYSWIERLLTGESDEMRMVWSAALPPHLADPVFADLGASPTLSLSEPIQALLLQRLLGHLTPGSVLPRELLPTSPMNGLLDIEKKNLVHLIHYLGLHDLAMTMRKTVKAQQREQVYHHLSVREQTYLQECLKQQDPLPATDADLHRITRDKKQLSNFCQSRGLFRLSKALQSQHSSFLWHLSRLLDTGRGDLLLKYSQEPADPNIERRLIKQVTTLVQFFQGRP